MSKWYRRARVLVVVGGALLVPASAHAADLPITDDRKVEVHGFVNPGFIVTTGNNYLANSKRGSFEFTEVGLNFTTQLTDKLRTGVQLFARDLGRIDNYTPRADWFYLDYRFDDWFGIRAGRVKIPFGLYNDSADIEAARVPVLLPQSLYSTSSRDFLLAQTGAEAYGRLRMGALGAFEYRLYGGTIYINPNEQSTISTPITSIDVPYVVGERLMWETPVDGLRLGGSLQALKFDLDFVVPPGTPGVKAGPATFEVPAVLAVGSVEYARDRALLAVEYSRWTVRIDSSVPVGGITSIRAVSERGYVMGSYRLTNWFAPGVYYSVMYPDVEHRSGRQNQQHDVAGTLRFDMNNWWLVKLEGHFMDGTATLDPSLNNGKPLTALARNWGAFFIKSSVHF